MNITSLNLINKCGYCPYCLTIKDARSMVRVRFTVDNIQEIINADQGTVLNPVNLLKWVEFYSDAYEVDFEIDTYRHAFIPVAILNGTPVCPAHLWTITQ